jgi:flagellar export protein FliJ
MAPKFTLQPVLDYRHNRVEILEVELGQLLQEQQRNQTYLEVLHESRRRLYEKLGDSQQGDIDLFLISRLRSSLKSVGERILQQQAHLSELSNQVLAKRKEMITAKQDEEALETLKNKEIERYQSEQAQQENRLQDDIYIAQAYRRSTSMA